MAQINFPVATANGQTFEASNGVIYTYVGTPPNGYWSGTFQDQSLQTLDGRYLKLDASNDPVTGACEFDRLLLIPPRRQRIQDDVYIKNNLCVNVDTSQGSSKGAHSSRRSVSSERNKYGWHSLGSSNVDLIGGRNSSV